MSIGSKMTYPNLRRILPFLKPYKGKFILGLIFTILFTIFNGFTFGAVIPVIDTLTPGQETFHFKISKIEINLMNLKKNK